MQVLETRILSKPEGVVVVEFLGESGEKIAVCGFRGHGIAARARGQSRARPACRTGQAEGLFAFEYRDGDEIRQLQGVKLANLKSVHEEALRSAGRAC
ncbi:hypothetical protein [Mesorhizobium sp. ORS 3428]|uniref:hypothetical protein n=1 Tax=Mesorhizobium sp. ORS 3428 TaxID=540997 RepID=UPI001041E76B|nr:hypothetical protein [Mesorhizobium sp. ORS 3428]